MTFPTELEPRITSQRALGLRSIGVKLALSVFVMLGAASLVAGYEISALALRYLVEGKEKAAGMVVDAATPVLAPALDFGDEEAIAEHTRRILQSRDVTNVAVWDAHAKKPLLALPRATGARPEPGSVRIGQHAIRVSRVIHSPGGTTVGQLSVEFSLLPEVSAFERVRLQIYLATGVLSLVLSLAMIALLRTTMLAPLSQLLGAMSSLSSGRAVALHAARDDELGLLERGFNDMARAIADREQRLEAARERTQQLLDHMQQAILVFDASGQLLDLRSHQSDLLFGSTAAQGSIAEALFPDESSIERELLEQWQETVFALPHERIAEVRELAPVEAFIPGEDGQKRQLALEFIPILEDHKVVRVMVLCTDVTEQRRLERTVEAKEAEHERQMQAMRTLVAGGGQLLVNVLRRAEERIAQSRAHLAQASIARSDVEHIFQLIHTIKGEARVFEQGLVTRAAANLECELGVLRDRVRTEPVDAHTASRQVEPGLRELEQALLASQTMLVEASPIGPAILDQLTVRKRDLDQLLELTRGRGDDTERLAQELASRPFGESLFNLREAVGRWAELLNKRVELELAGRDVPIPPALGGVLAGVLTHLVRNAVAHGIEGPLARSELGKPAVGVVTLHAETMASGVRIVVRDDGRGADPEQLSHTSATLAEGLFEPGSSSAGSELRAADLAGQGMGLAAVRAELSSVGYHIEVSNRPGQGLEARIEPEKAGTS